MPTVTRAPAPAPAPSQPLQRLPRRIRPLGALLVPLALGAAACGDMRDTDAAAAVDTAVTAVTPRGFTLSLTPGVPGMTPEDLTLVPAVAIATVTATDMSNTHYAVATQARFVFGQEYTLTITKAGYRMTSPSFARRAAGSEANILKMTLTVAGVEVRGRITDTEDETSIRFLGGAKATPVPLLTGTVSLTLSAGARVAGTNPAGTEKTYTSTATNITVRAEDGTTTKTYTVAVADYDADSNPYGVYTIGQLHAVRNGRTDSYRLMQNLTLPDIGADCEAPFPSQDDYCAKGFSPIGLEASPFTGTFDGNGQRIQNLAIRRSATDSVGLFGHMGASGEIRRLGVVLAEAGVTGDNAVGGLVGTSWGIVTESYAEGAVSGSGDGIGGLVGHMNAGTMTQSHAAGPVYGFGDFDGPSDSIGGLVGYMTASAVAESYAAAAVFGSGNYVGGLVGKAEGGGIVTESYAKGAVSGSGDGIGGLVGWSDGTVSNASAEGAVFGGTHVGGLVGWSDGTVTDASAKGAVSGGGDGIGGLVGRSTGTVSDASAEGAVSGGGNDVGGLVGWSDGTVSDASAEGAVSGGGNDVGGLVGWSDGTVSDASAAGAVSGGGEDVGGLVGRSTGTVSNASAAGAVSGSGDRVGGLVGRSIGTVSNASAAGAVSGSANDVGGLVGRSDGTVSDASAAGAVSGSGTRVGGLVGLATRDRITNSHASGGVSGGNNAVGGLVGYTSVSNTVNDCYATGDVFGNGSYVGGLTGDSSGTVANSYATGDVSGDSNAVGGLLGWVGGTITTSYAIGAVSGNNAVGGLVGIIRRGTVSNCYATGAVSGSGSAVGGLVGHKQGGAVSNSYFPSGRPVGADGSALPSWAKKTAFLGFAFLEDDNPSWKWVDGKWPQLKDIEVAQTTPSLTHHSAMVTAQSTSGFTMALRPPFKGLKKDDWALYKVTSSAITPVNLSNAALESSMNGTQHAFTVNLTTGTYYLLSTKADVIILPLLAGHITVTVP